MGRFETGELPDLAGYEVLVGVCGGIAAYKVCEVVSRLVQRGAGVTVAMTRAARKFVGTTTFEALTARQVITSLWSAGGVADSPHIRLTAAADLTLIAPATADMIGKMASGIADDVVSTLVTCATFPVVLAPAMNDRMWANPIVQGNVRKLIDHGYTLVGPKEGWLACRNVGAGRMAEPEEILEAVVPLLTGRAPHSKTVEGQSAS
ncbi:MAG: flavoprotein [Planctomycetota bacterium]